MPTTFNVISLGNLASIDTIEGDTDAENASALVGLTFGGAGDALVNDVVEFSQVSSAGGTSGVYDMNNAAANDTFSIDGGPAQTFDGTSVYNATITYIDGTTANITAVVFQDTAGNTYLAPEFSVNADQSALEAGAIRSLTLNSLSGNNFSGMNANRNSWDGFVTCFTEGTTIQTAQGLVAVEDLQLGMQVLTMDHGFQPVRWLGSKTVDATGDLAPILFKAGALGNAEDLLVSPQHRMLIGGWRAEMMLGMNEVLAAAKSLVNDHDILPVEGGAVTYHHVMFDRHELIYAAGIPSESFHPGEQALNALDAPVRDEILQLFPALRWFGAHAYGQVARPVLRNFEVRTLVA